MEVKIYQIKDEKFENCNYVFMGLDIAKKHNFSLDDYSEIYSFIYTHLPNKENNYNCLISKEEKYKILEGLFKQFNINRPKDFFGRSLSVSDVVKLDNEYYYCDDIGWVML